MSPEIKTRLVYPDPFKPVGLEFELPEDAVVTVRILDAVGRVISVLLEQRPMCKGAHKVTVRTSEGSTEGMYFELQAGEGKKAITITRKIY
jgi:hypothetical protein